MNGISDSRNVGLLDCEAVIKVQIMIDVPSSWLFSNLDRSCFFSLTAE